MSFWKINKATVALTAAFVVLVGGAYISGTDCGSGCMLSSLFSTSEAVAGPGCSAEAKAACTKPCTEKGDVKTAEATEAKVTTANATDGKTCDKEACIAKCMAEKGYTRAEAEACYAKCQAAKASNASASDGCSKPCGGSVNIIKTANATDGEPKYSREAYIDACVAKGMSKEAAVKAADEKDLTSMASDKDGCTKATKASSAKSDGCCASKKASASTASAKPSGASN
ncbi:MAG: hypothetical protein GF341_03900 [candidate division Zixibacteria bacterium]|nr:hypothetical protein [candidate division Zixibacteria bacterium]